MTAACARIGRPLVRAFRDMASGLQRGAEDPLAVLVILNAVVSLAVLAHLVSLAGRSQ